MKAIDIEKEKLVLKDTKDPVTNPGEILIKTTATAINRADLVQRSGLYPPPPGASPILGLECAGEVIGLGEGVEGFEEGQKVCALLTGGGYAEKVAVSEGQVLPIPSNFDTILSAAIPEVFGTAFLNLYMEANLVPNERVLLHAGASGVGTAAIQLCKAFGNPCFVTAGNLEKIKFCKNLGADDGSIRTKESFLKKMPSTNSTHARILDNITALALSQLITTAASFVSTAWVARSLGPEGYGIIGFGTAFVSYFSLLIIFSNISVVIGSM